jgi:GNAT superfamily N-acetyltransferase
LPRHVVVRADFAIEGSVAELLDIRHISLANSIRRWLGLRRDYRGRGLGTKLLTASLAELKSHGIRRVYGRIEGTHVERLKRWYRREGFQVDDETLEIWCEL